MSEKVSYDDMMRAYMHCVVGKELPRAGWFMGVPFQRNEDGTYSFGPTKIEENFIYRKNDG